MYTFWNNFVIFCLKYISCTKKNDIVNMLLQNFSTKNLSSKTIYIYFLQ